MKIENDVRCYSTNHNPQQVTGKTLVIKVTKKQTSVNTPRLPCAVMVY